MTFFFIGCHKIYVKIIQPMPALCWKNPLMVETSRAEGLDCHDQSKGHSRAGLLLVGTQACGIW